MQMLKSLTWSRRWRPLTAGVAALACLAILFSFTPVRQAAADFLGLFRVRKFAVIPIDPAQAERLEALARQAESVLGEPTVVRPEGVAQPVASTEEASALAGFAVRAPASLPQGASLSEFEVQLGPAMHYEVERAVLQALLEAVGIQGAPLPEAETLTFDLDLPYAASQEYSLGRGALTLTQMPSPEVALPEGIDPVALGELAFQFLGMPRDDASRLARAIDWSTTLVIPLPTDLGVTREVTVDGATGLLLQGQNTAQGHSLVAWERDGVLYMLKGNNVDLKLLLDFADSLR
jgi:hypothetical protein